MRTRAKAVRRFSVLVPLLLAITACDRNDESTNTKVVVTEKPTRLPEWLSSKEKIDPAVWLRSREVGHLVGESDPEVGRVRRALLQAQTRFYEDPRMIANRTSQIGAMLAEVNQPERFVDILTGLIDVADVSPDKKLYGEMCQHYLNDRKSGMDRAAAIRQLMTAYKSGGPAKPKGQIP